MTTPRRQLVDPDNACDYHLVSRCVRRAWLCGLDWRTRRDYSHRKRWLVERLHSLTRCFAVELYAYSIMSNHFHLAVRYDPKACESWSDEEVAARWVDAFPPTERGTVVPERKRETRELLLGDAARLARARRTLGSLSAFMKHLKQPIARRANREDDCQGHFFEQRFYSGALLNADAVLAAMAYVDLNPVRAKIAARIEECHDASIAARLEENDAAALAEYLRPVASGLERSMPMRGSAWVGPAITLGDYIAMLRSMVEAEVSPEATRPDWVSRWLARITSLSRRQRAYGNRERLSGWAIDRGLQPREAPLPV